MVYTYFVVLFGTSLFLDHAHPNGIGVVAYSGIVQPLPQRHKNCNSIKIGTAGSITIKSQLQQQQQTPNPPLLKLHSSNDENNDNNSNEDNMVISERRSVVRQLTTILPLLVAGLSTVTINSDAVAATTEPKISINDDLPSDAVRSYYQYRYQLQLSADYYIFDLQSKLTDVSDWGEINELFSGSNPSRVEREFTNLYRIIGLSMPPDESDAIQDARYQFERSMNQIKTIVFGVRRDLPIEINTATAIPQLLTAWDNGRLALNTIFAILNTVTGLNELTIIPPAGPQQYTQYPRSERKYIDLKKKFKLCQNRGGPTLSNAWGTLMVSGYLQDSCGIPDLESYFYQS